MSFEKFLQEAPMTHHSKVETVLRELGLKYKIETVTTGKKFIVEDSKVVVFSYNFGKVTVSKDGVVIGSADSLTKSFRDDLYTLVKEATQKQKVVQSKQISAKA